MSDDLSTRRGSEEGDGAGPIEARLQQAEAELRRRQAEIERLEASVANLQRTLAAIDATFAWQLINRFWRARDRLLARSTLLRRVYQEGFGRVKRVVRPHLPDPAHAYAAWVALHTPDAAQLGAMRSQGERIAHRPLISVVTPVHDIAEPLLRRCIASVRAQVWDRWELILVDDGSRQPHVARVLEEEAGDPRVRFERLPRNVGIVGATNRGLALATGEFAAFLDHDDELAPEALHRVAVRLDADPTLDLVYSDEDKLDEAGRRLEPFFKPDWSPDLLLSMNYLSHLSVYRMSLLREVGGLREGLDGSQDYDLALRFTELTPRIAHVPEVLYHWRKVEGSDAAARGAKEYALEAGRRALQDAVGRRALDARVERTQLGVYRVRYAVKGTPLVSIVMPTRDKAAVLRTCVESVDQRSTWQHRELLVVDNGSTEAEAVAYLGELATRHRVLRDDRPFNWSAINNAAAHQAKGEYLLFLNNDMDVIAPDWIEALLEQAQRPEVGAVGTRLLYPDGTVQHAGVVLGLGGVAGHAFKHLPGQHAGYGFLGHAVRNVSAVTGACMMVRREVFERFGGFDERLRVAFNDIDFCLRLREAGLVVVYTPYASLHHHESVSRGTLHPPEDEELMKLRWHAALADDPYYSPHLTRDREDYSLRVEARHRARGTCQRE